VAKTFGGFPWPRPFDDVVDAASASFIWARLMDQFLEAINDHLEDNWIKIITAFVIDWMDCGKMARASELAASRAF